MTNELLSTGPPPGHYDPLATHEASFGTKFSTWVEGEHRRRSHQDHPAEGKGPAGRTVADQEGAGCILPAAEEDRRSRLAADRRIVVGEDRHSRPAVGLRIAVVEDRRSPAAGPHTVLEGVRRTGLEVEVRHILLKSRLLSHP